MRRPAYLLIEEVAERQRRSVGSVHRLTAANRIPCRNLPGLRRLVFVEADLEAWENGAELEVVELADGGRIVRPKLNRGGS